MNHEWLTIATKSSTKSSTKSCSTFKGHKIWCHPHLLLPFIFLLHITCFSEKKVGSFPSFTYFSHFLAFAPLMTWVLVHWSLYHASLHKMLATNTHTHTHTHTIQLSQLWEGVQVENSLTSLFESQFFFSVLRVVLDALPKYGGYSISIHLILSWESVKHMFCDMRHLNSHYLIFHP